jgi:superfamily II DNA or RNA helicase
MRLVIEHENPAVVRMFDFEDPFDQIKESLIYTDKAAQFAYTRFKNSPAKRWMDSDKFEARVAELKAEIKKSLLFQDDRGFYTYSGLSSYLSKKTGIAVESTVKYPPAKSLAWDNIPKFNMHPYQKSSLENLLATRHAGVELGTGLGKSFIILHLLRSLGLKAVVMTPATSISNQLYNQFVKAFGKKYVGAFFDGKKESKKLITVANAQSLTKVEEGTPHWTNLSSAQVFIADESHQCPANTLEKVCLGVAAKAPYRFFFSATQMRNDGRALVLEGITGPIVYSKTVQEGVDEGYLAKPKFRIVEIPSPSTFDSKDANALSRKHLYYNPVVAEKIGKLVNSAADAGMPVLVLIEEVEQFTKLLPYLRHTVGFAHGPLNEDNRPLVPEQFWTSDPQALVESFNSGKLPVLVGTSCISTGTDILTVKFLVYWQGGKSEIQVKQAIGRGTRKCPGKTECTVVDIDVVNIPTVHNQAVARRAIYADLYPDIKTVVV